MKKLLSRLGAAALTMALLLHCLPGVFIARAEAAGPDVSALTRDAAQAFADILCDRRIRHGLAAAQGAQEDGYDRGPAGLAYAALLDFEGDGVPELYFYYFCEDTMFEEVWRWNGSDAEQVRYEQLIPGEDYMGECDYGISYINGWPYLYHSEQFSTIGYSERAATLYQLRGGRFERAEEMRASITGVDFEPDDLVYSLSIGGSEEIHLEIRGESARDGAPEEAAFMNRCFSAASQLYALYWGDLTQYEVSDIAGLIDRLEQRSVEGTAAEPLAELAYVGSKAACRLTAAQAEGYAAALEAWMADFGGDVNMSWATLLDIGGDGVPLLLCSRGFPDYINGHCIFWGMDSCLYEIRNGNCVLHDFEDDTVRAGQGGHGIRGFAAYTGLRASGWLTATDLDEVRWDYTAVKLFYTARNGALSLEGWQLRSASKEVDETGSPIEKTETGSVHGADWTPHLDGLKETRLIHASGIEPFIVGNVTDAQTAVRALRAYAEAKRPHYRFPQPTEDEDAFVRAVAEAVAAELGGEVTGIYKLADGLYYVVIEVDGTAGVLVKGVRERGAVRWKIVRRDPELPEEAELERIAIEAEQTGNLDLDYGAVSGFRSGEDVCAYVRDRLDSMEGVTPNDAAKTELAAFLETAVSAVCTGTVTGAGNRVTPDAETVRDLTRRADAVRRQLDGLLAEEDVTLNKALTIIFRILWHGADLGQPCQVTLDRELADALGECTLQLYLGDERHSLTVSGARLQALVERYGALIVQVQKIAEGVYMISFLDGGGAVLSEIETGVTVGLPAPSMTSTIMVSYASRSDNWGGQFDDAAGVISFEARYTGQYEIIDNDSPIDDISDLPDEAQAAIRFLVSKGYLETDGRAFRPDSYLTRYAFTQALTGMFFALDRSLRTDFPDVPEDSPYYPYVASAQARHIVTGFDDGTFGGERNMTVEQMLAIASRTLIEQKGYRAPESPAGYVGSFSDSDRISDWALAQVAMAVRDGLQDRGGALNPTGDITRAQAAQILYRLFLLLYEVPPTALELPEAAPEAEATTPAPQETAAAADAPAAGGAGAAPEAEAKRALSPGSIALVAGGALIVLGGGGAAVWYTLSRRKRES